MKKSMFFALAALALLVVANASAVADSFLVQADLLNYYYSIKNGVTDLGTFTGVGADIYLVKGFDLFDATIIESPKTAPYDNFQLYDDYNAVTSSSGYWSTPSRFYATGSGKDLESSPPDWELFFQPDKMSAGEGGVTFLDYSYQFTANFHSDAVYDSGWGLFLNQDPPYEFTGTFSGTFQRTYDNSNHPITDDDIYTFSVYFSMPDDTGSGDESTTDPDYVPKYTTDFGGPEVPEPGTILLVGTGLGAVCLARKRKK